MCTIAGSTPWTMMSGSGAKTSSRVAAFRPMRPRCGICLVTVLRHRTSGSSTRRMRDDSLVDNCGCFRGHRPQQATIGPASRAKHALDAAHPSLLLR
jgi:hypothetical protein